jgi:hypothetical protein
MVLLSDREYLKQLLLAEFRNDPDVVDPDFEVYDYLRKADYSLSLDEDDLHLYANITTQVKSDDDILNLVDLPIRGSGKQVELETLIVPKGEIYLSQIMSKIPLDVMIHKGKTGIGGTTLAVMDRRKWVICMGSRNLVKSKSEVHKNSIGVYAIGHGGATDSDIMKYKGNTIFTTWASLERVMLNVDPAEWSLLIDENHEFITKGGYQGSDINKLIRVKDAFRHVTLMSATETKIKDYKGGFDGMDILNIEWEEKEVFNIEMVKTYSLVSSLVELSKRVLDDVDKPNLHVFLNKLDSIIRVVSMLETILGRDLSDEISIVASSSKEMNSDKISRIGKGLYKIEDEKIVKRLNFYTSTSFTGIDVYDDFGDIIMAVHGSIQYTRLDFNFDIPQIIGRIRNPRDGMQIQLLYSTCDSNKAVSVKEFIKGYKDLEQDAMVTVNWYNSLSVKAKDNKKNISRVIGMEGVELVDGKALKDDAFFMNKRKSYNRDNFYYSKNGATNKELTITCGNDIFQFFTGEEVVISEQIFETNDLLHVKKGSSFRFLLTELLDEMDLDGWESDWWKEDNSAFYNVRTNRANLYSSKNTLLIERYPFIKDTIDLFSPDQIKELGLTLRAIRSATERKQEEHLFVKIKSKIALEIGKKYEVIEIKKKLNKALSELGVQKSVASTYIKKIYPSIQKKQIRMDQRVLIFDDEYYKIKRSNFNLNYNNRIDIGTTKDENGNVIEIFKIVKNGGRMDVYFLPL